MPIKEYLKKRKRNKLKNLAVNKKIGVLKKDFPKLFDKHKSDFLKKADKSKEQSIDKDIILLIKKINSLKNYYTTSSCSGRVVLLSKKSEKKQDTKWLFKSHKKVSFKEIKKSVEKLPKYDVWFRFEPAIFHIACKTIEDAQRIVNIARSVGFKKSGIQSTRRKITVEIASSDCIDTIIAKGGKLLVAEKYFKVLIEEANKKLKKNKEKIEQFYNAIMKESMNQFLPTFSI